MILVIILHWKGEQYSTTPKCITEWKPFAARIIWTIFNSGCIQIEVWKVRLDPLCVNCLTWPSLVDNYVGQNFTSRKLSLRFHCGQCVISLWIGITSMFQYLILYYQIFFFFFFYLSFICMVSLDLNKAAIVWIFW